MSQLRLNGYHIMWVFVFFDLPVIDKLQRKKANKFRTNLIKDGFDMVQYSIYARHCASSQHAETFINRVKSYVLDEGNIQILQVTDKQFGQIINFNYGYLHKERKRTAQLELF